MKAADGLTNKERGTCENGHPWISKNKVKSPSGQSWKCRICKNIRTEAYRKQKRKYGSMSDYITALKTKSTFGCGHLKTEDNTITYPSGRLVCRQCRDTHDEKRRLNYKPKTPKHLICVYCQHPLPPGRRKYCSTKCQYADDAQGFRGRCIAYDVPYKAVTKRSIWESDNYACQHCGKTCNKASPDWRDRPTIDHVWPLSIIIDGRKSPGHVRSNLQTLCGACNGKKGIRLEREPKMQWALGQKITKAMCRSRKRNSVTKLGSHIHVPQEMGVEK